jgi:hypothetical protein
MIELVKLDTADLNDIPAGLRALAERIENNDYGEVHSLLLVMPREHDWPITLQWGINHGACEPVIQLSLALEWHVKAAAGFAL